jgi:hypothetical protein
MKYYLRTYFLFLFLFSITLFKAQSFSWAQSVDGANTTDDEGLAICSDTASNIFITGAFASPILSFGTNTVANTGQHDVFLAKYTSNGNILWARSAIGSGRDICNSITCDIAGNSFITGYSTGSSIIFGSYTLSAPGVFVAKYDPNGTVLWARNASGNTGYSVYTDSNGNLFVTGSYQNTVVFGSYTLTNSGSFDAFLVKYDPSGNVLWAKKIGASGYEEAFSVCTDKLDNVYIAGRSSSTVITVGTVTLNNPTGNTNAFVVKFDNSGNALIAKSFGGSSNDGAYSINADQFNNTYLTGYISSSPAAFDTYTLSNSGSQNVFIVKMDPNLNVLWANSLSGTGYDDGFSIHTYSGGAYVCGGLNSNTIMFGSSSLSKPPGSIDPMYIINYDSTGNVICSYALASGGDDLNGITTDKSGNAYICSDFEASPFMVGANTLTLTGNENIFVAKFSCLSTGIHSNEQIQLKSSAHPNPVNDYYVINIESGYESLEISFYNSIGQIVLTTRLINGANRIQTNNLVSGFYSYHISSNSIVVGTGKLVVGR